MKKRTEVVLTAINDDDHMTRWIARIAAIIGSVSAITLVCHLANLAGGA